MDIKIVLSEEAAATAFRFLERSQTLYKDVQKKTAQDLEYISHFEEAKLAIARALFEILPEEEKLEAIQEGAMNADEIEELRRMEALNHEVAKDIDELYGHLEQQIEIDDDFSHN